MKWTRFAVAGLSIAGFLAFRLQMGPLEPPPTITAPDSTVAGPGPTVTALDPTVTALDPTVTAPDQVSSAATPPPTGSDEVAAVPPTRSDQPTTSSPAGPTEAAAPSRRGSDPASPSSPPDADGASPSSPPGADGASEEPATASADTDEAPEATSRDGSSERRRSRRWRRNRYPGPIPTPAEWEPPEGPVRIGLQAGHWRADEAPDELSGLRGNGTRWAGTHEWEVNLEIARRAAAMLEEQGYEVDILPAVVPPGYRAHLFISIHADGSGDSRASGYRVAAPRRDATGRAARAAALLEERYGEVTGLPRIPTVTRRMRSYYAFNFRRYEHALHPMTIGVIIETGFLTSAGDRRIIVDDPDRAARGIVEAVAAFPHTPPPEVSASR